MLRAHSTLILQITSILLVRTMLTQKACYLQEIYKGTRLVNMLTVIQGQFSL